MGRLIISETEKKNILSLYESTNDAPPPSESVLIDSKNPFKYPEYINARKVYNSTMKDGDLFYQTKYEFEGFVKETLFKELYDSFVDKTIRVESDDDILKIYRENINPIYYNHRSNNDINIGDITFYYKINKYSFSIYYSKTKQGEKIGLTKNSYTNHLTKEYVPSETVTKEKYGAIYDALLSISSELKTKYLEIFNNPSVLPDEYFEIRKIQRQQTDF